MPAAPKTPTIGVGTLRVSQRAKELVLQTLNENRLSYGPLQQRFESEFAHLHDCRFGVMSNSGTSALHIALQALKQIHGWQDGDEVIVPAITFVATVNVVLHNNLIPVFADVEPDYYGIDPREVRRKITPRTRALLPAHLFGQPCDMDSLQAIARAHDLRIVEDSCETMFANHGVHRVGSLGDIGCFSTYVAHLLVTGVGGIGTTSNPEYAVLMRSLMNHGRDAIYLSIDDDDGKSAEELRLIVARRFSFVNVGHSFRVTEMEAALGLAALETWQPMIAQRRSNAAFLSRHLEPFVDKMQLPQVRPGCQHSYMMYPIVLREQTKYDLVNFLEEHGVETRDMLPLTNQPIYQRLLHVREDEYPEARRINESGFYIGCHQDLTSVELEYMVELFERFWRARRARVSEGSALVLQTRDSERWLDAVFEVLPTDLFTEVIAIDSGSSDGTVARLEERGMRVWRQRRGDDLLPIIGSSDITAESLVFFPVNGRHQPADIARMLLLLERGHDMVVASRFIMGGERRSDGVGVYRSVGNRLITLMANLLFFGNASDSLSGFRAVRRSRLLTLPRVGDDLPFLYRLSIHAMKSGWRVAESPTVEVVSPDSISYAAIASSLLPIFGVLVNEYVKRSGEEGPV